MVEYEAEKETPSVGATLKAGREQQNLGVNDIANQLHLDLRIIRALEEDNFQDLPDPIYVRGYIRSYCKLLGLEPDTILEDFRQAMGRDDPEIIPDIKYPTQSSSSDKPVKAFTWLIVLGLIVLLIAWWQSNFLVSNDDKATAVVVIDPAVEQNITDSARLVLEEIELNTSESTIVPGGDVPGAISIAPDDMDSAATTDNSGLMPIQQPSPETTMPETLATDDADASVAGDGVEFTATDTMASSTTDLSETETTTPIPPSESTNAVDESGEESTASVGPDILELNLTADSWIEIFDVNDQRIYFDLGRNGDQLTLRGTAPFDILLGFAQGVSVEFNGEAVDFSPYTRGGVARFNLGE